MKRSFPITNSQLKGTFRISMNMPSNKLVIENKNNIKIGLVALNNDFSRSTFFKLDPS
jgi:hypothetical protein